MHSYLVHVGSYSHQTSIGHFLAPLLGIPSLKWICFTTPYPSTAPAEEIGRFCERWAAEALFALTTMTACSQHVGVCAAWALDTAVKYDV